MNSLKSTWKKNRRLWLLILPLTCTTQLLFGQDVVADLAQSSQEMEVFNADGFIKLLVRLGLNLGITTVLIRMIYYPITRRKDYMFTFMLVSVSIFFLCYILASVSLDLAFALGLFAIFGIIRYRTDAIPIKEMTYLFIVIGLAVMNSLAAGVSMAEIGLANGLILLLTYGLEKVWLLRHESHKIVLYERIELIKSGNRAALKADLEERTGIIINRVEVGRIDFLRDTALVKIFFYQDAQEGHFEETAGGGE
jgi:hypothetical protein